MAATGLPEPQENHAVIMVRFAAECLSKFQMVIHDLSMTLGEDTNELAFRVGIHSGSVTAGVLRGERSRFQLFGDTGEWVVCCLSCCRIHQQGSDDDSV